MEYTEKKAHHQLHPFVQALTVPVGALSILTLRLGRVDLGSPLSLIYITGISLSSVNNTTYN